MHSAGRSGFGELLLACESDARGSHRPRITTLSTDGEYLLRAPGLPAAAVVLTDEDRAELKGPFLGERNPGQAILRRW